MPDAVSAEAPGRVNLIGDHTDYHEGLVLPTVIPQRTRVHLRRRVDRIVSAHSVAMRPAIVDYELGSEQVSRGWIDYVQGVTAMLARRGIRLSGFDLRIESSIPPGAGVSSSAALTVSLLRALRAAFDLAMDDVTIATVARAAETDFVGAPIGIMDQMAASVGLAGQALLIDTRTLEVERVPLPADIEIMVIDSGVPHAHAGGLYAIRRRESFDAAAQLGVRCLRDVDEAALARGDGLPPLLARRARHVVTENERVRAAVDAIRAADPVRLGTLFGESHRSMRDDFETSTPHVDALVGIADAQPEVYGSRLTGGGFGGAVVILAKAGTALTTAARIRDVYQARTGQIGRILMPEINPGQLSM